VDGDSVLGVVTRSEFLRGLVERFLARVDDTAS
jgi:hypothetical protein